MKNTPTGKTNKGALDALLSTLIILATSRSTQQAIALLALMLFALQEMAL